VAALHLAASTPNVEILEHFNDFDEPYVKQAAHGAPEVVDGFFSLPEAPGLGVALDEDVIAEHPKQELHFRLFSDDWHLRRAGVEAAR
jgi:galactonate dehydratase